MSREKREMYFMFNLQTKIFHRRSFSFRVIMYIVNFLVYFNYYIIKIVLCNRYIGTRFDKVNEHMRCLLIKKEYELRYTWRKSALTTRGCIMYTNKYKSILWTSM